MAGNQFVNQVGVVTGGAKGIGACLAHNFVDKGAFVIFSDVDAQHPVGRVGKPEDIASACLFLASEMQAGFITGHNLIVDGGMTRKMIYVE